MYEFLKDSTDEIVLEYDNKYENLSHEDLAPLCRQGDLIALYEMGSRCCLGVDGEKADPMAARQFFEKILHIQRNARAVYLLGEMYRDREFGSENEPICRECYEYGHEWGDARSAEKLGLLYKWGEFVEKDLNKAISLFNEAIDLGDDHAYFNLGDTYIELKNYVLAKECLEKAVEAEDYSNILLGNLYEDGAGVAQDYDKAREYYEKAYGLEIIEGAYFLGRLYLSGKGVSEDVDKARKYIEEAVNGGYERAYYELGAIHVHYAEKGIDAESNLNKGIDFLKKAPDYLDDVTYQMLGIAYRLLGNLEKARDCFSEAYKLGNPEAEKSLRALDGESASTHRKELLKTDINKLLELYAAGEEDAAFAIANSYSQGINGAEVDYVKAYAFFSYVCEKKLPGKNNALLAMANMIIDGYIPGKSASEGISIAKKLAEEGFTLSYPLLGEVYRRGRGVSPDYEKAEYYYRKGAEQNNNTSRCCLAEMYFTGQISGKQNLVEGIKLLKEVLAVQPENETARWYMSCFEFDGVKENGEQIVEKNSLHALEEMERLADKGSINAIKRLAEIYEKIDTSFFDLQKAIKYNKLRLEKGDLYGAVSLAAINILDEYQHQTDTTNEDGVNYAKMYIEKSSESRGLKETMLKLMMGVYQKRGLDTVYSREGMQYIFDSFERYPYEYFSDAGLNTLTEIIEWIYPYVGAPYDRLKRICQKNTYISRAADRILSNNSEYMGVITTLAEPETVEEEPQEKWKGQQDSNESRNAILGGIIVVALIAFFFLLFKLMGGGQNQNSVQNNETEKTEVAVAQEETGKQNNEIKDILENGTFTFVDGYGNSREVELNNSIKPCVYDKEGFEIINGRAKYEDERYSSRCGIDVSKFQGTIDWHAVKNDGIDFCFIRIGNRGYSQGVINLDPEFINNIEGAKEEGLDVGIYFFSQAITEQEAIEEADFVVDNLTGYTIDLPIVYNTGKISKEDSRTDNISNEQIAKNAKAFCDRISDLGYNAALYTDMLWEAYVFDMEKMGDYKIWYSDYYSEKPQTPYDFEYWQYSNQGRVAGISTDVDLDIQIYEK
ncbi:GH25 family lysozyme [Butyrivibrio sp.]|uniref:GH25 family lysozyme n=1 Tax=Butyrivibrio sp. TaxID=28121 RepID=UPI0025B7B950|nr:GH25 family lysozyme [Butyrivibrio sp.]MBE5838445.1 hypothetical protein [Butyrivibrio sp.]